MKLRWLLLLGFALTQASFVATCAGAKLSSAVVRYAGTQSLKTVGPTQAESAFWQPGNRKNRADLRRYLAASPKGAFVSVAGIQRDELTAALMRSTGLIRRNGSNPTVKAPGGARYAPGWRVEIREVHVRKRFATSAVGSYWFTPPKWGFELFKVDPNALAIVDMPGPVFTLGSLVRASGIFSETSSFRVIGGGAAMFVVRTGGTYGLGARVKVVGSICKAKVEIENHTEVNRIVVSPDVLQGRVLVRTREYSNRVRLQRGLYSVTWTFQCFSHIGTTYAARDSLTILVAPPGAALSPAGPGEFIRLRSSAGGK